jgi:epoxyqueuosine reductase QueG
MNTGIGVGFLNMNVDTLRDFIKGLGVSDIGFSKVTGFVPENWSKYNYAISFVIQLSNGIINDIKENNEPTQTYFAHYRSVNYHINEVTLRTTIALQNSGYNAIAIPSSQSLHDKPYNSVFSHKKAATLSGLGWIGKSGLFIHHKFGPRVRLGTILTDMELPLTTPITTSKCGDCNLCVIKCPAMAIEGTKWVQGMERNKIYDAHACSSYMKKNFQHIGRGSVCGVCISTCPIGNV